MDFTRGTTLLNWRFVLLKTVELEDYWFWTKIRHIPHLKHNVQVHVWSDSAKIDICVFEKDGLRTNQLKGSTHDYS